MKWFWELLCWHEWRNFSPEPDYPELDYRVCRNCDRKEMLYV